MPRKSKKKVTFREKADISGKRGCLGGPRLPPLLPVPAPPPNQMLHPVRLPKRTIRSELPLRPTLSSSWPPAPPPGSRQLLKENQPVVNSLSLTSRADPGERRFPRRHQSRAEEKTIPEGAGPAQVRHLILLQRGHSEKAKREIEQLHRKVVYLTRQYKDRVRDVEELLEAVRQEWEETERERHEVEQQNAELRSFNAELRSLIARLQTFATQPPGRGRFPASRAPPATPHPRAHWLRDRLANEGLILYQ